MGRDSTRDHEQRAPQRRGPAAGCPHPCSSSDTTPRRLFVQDPRDLQAPVPRCPAMEALGPGGDRVSPSSSTGSLDFRRLSTRVDSAYSSFSAASGDPEPRTPSPGAELLPYLDSAYVSVVWSGPSSSARPDAVLRTTQRPGPRAPHIPGTPGPLSRQATPLLYALAAEAEAEAAARASEPPSPPASRAAYRQRLQGAQRRVLRETSFQRKELRMSLPARLRPAVPPKPAAAHPRSASLSHPGAEEPARAGAGAGALGPAGRRHLANQQRTWCFSEPGKLDRVGWGGGPSSECLSEACASSGLARPDTQQLRRAAARAEFKGWKDSRARSTEDVESGSTKLGYGPRPASRSRSQSTSGEVLGPCRGSERTVATVQVVSQGLEPPRPLSQAKHSRFFAQRESAGGCPPELPQRDPASCDTGIMPTRLPSLPDDDVFLEEALQDRMSSPPDAPASQGLPARVHHASDQQCKNGLSQKAGQTKVPVECPFHECPGTLGVDEHWQGVNGSMGIFRPMGCSASGTANGDVSAVDSPGPLAPDPSSVLENKSLKCNPVDALEPSGGDTPRLSQHTSLAWGTGQPGSKPTWPNQHFEELVQELARLDPSLSDTLACQPSPEPPLGLLDGLIPSAEVWAAMRPASGEAGEEAIGIAEAGPYQFSLTQQLPTSQEEARSEKPTLHPVPDQTCDQGRPTPDNSLQAKKVELASLLQKMLLYLRGEQERLQGADAAWTRRKAALEATVGQACASRELERFSRFMTDLERVLGLLLLLGSRLARVRLALARAGSDSDPDERESLLQRLGLLQRQQEDAQELKEHVARRERALRDVLGRALPAEDLQSYCALLAGKAAVLAHQRGLDERVRLLQDQLDAIRHDLSYHSPFSQAVLVPRDLSSR